MQQCAHCKNCLSDRQIVESHVMKAHVQATVDRLTRDLLSPGGGEPQVGLEGRVEDQLDGQPELPGAQPDALRRTARAQGQVPLQHRQEDGATERSTPGAGSQEGGHGQGGAVDYKGLKQRGACNEGITRE